MACYEKTAAGLECIQQRIYGRCWFNPEQIMVYSIKEEYVEGQPKLGKHGPEQVRVRQVKAGAKKHLRFKAGKAAKARQLTAIEAASTEIGFRAKLGGLAEQWGAELRK